MVGYKKLMLITILLLLFNADCFGQTNIDANRIDQYTYSIVKFCTDLLVAVKGEAELLYVEGEPLKINFTEESENEEQYFVINDFIAHYEKKVNLSCKTNGVLFQEVILTEVKTQQSRKRTETSRISQKDILIKDYIYNHQIPAEEKKQQLRLKSTPVSFKNGKITFQSIQLIDPEFNRMKFLNGVVTITYKESRLIIDYSKDFLLEINDNIFRFEEGVWVGQDEKILRSVRMSKKETFKYPLLFSPDGIGEDLVDRNDITSKYAKMLEFIYANLKLPKESRKKKRFVGTATVILVVDVNGRIKSARIGTDPGYGCGKEALRVIKSMDIMWIPGRDKNGIPMDVKMTIPIRFSWR